MKWKSFPYWLKIGFILPAAILVLYFVCGLIVALIHGGSCITPPCSAGSGYCPSTFYGCFLVYNNFMAVVLNLPTGIIFYSTALMNNFYNHIIIFQSEGIIINLILYFGLGALLGFIIQNINPEN
jgi:hypothetical protein